MPSGTVRYMELEARMKDKPPQRLEGRVRFCLYVAGTWGTVPFWKAAATTQTPATSLWMLVLGVYRVFPEIFYNIRPQAGLPYYLSLLFISVTECELLPWLSDSNPATHGRCADLGDFLLSRRPDSP